MSSPDSSNEAESNALGLSVDPQLNTPSEEVTPVNDSSSSLDRPTPKLKKQLSITSSRQRNTTPQHTFLQRLSSFARRDKSNKANRQHTISPLTQLQHPADRNIHSYSEPVIQTIRASPEHMRGPSAVRDPDDAHKGSPLDHSLLGSPASTPRLEQHTSPGRSGRSSTSPIPSHVNGDLPHTRKRLIVCCDGTWQDGISQNRRWRYSNVLKLSRCIDHEDIRTHPPTPQIVFYQSGLGTQDNLISQLVDGAFGVHLAEKVQEVYAWLAQNYWPGDDIFLFGFSRGAYTARMVATLIGEIGLLSRSEMDHFADIFVAYQKRGKTKDPEERKKYDDLLAPYHRDAAHGRRKFVDMKFCVKVVGVFDTVGSFGLPAEFTMSPKIRTLFDFPDKILPEHIERAYHAMALDEERADFNVTKFYQKPEARINGQYLRQMWFSGSHSDVGGGFQDHGLSDLALVWMVAEVEDCLAINIEYLKSLPNPVKPWGKQGPHYSKNGIFALGSSVPRVIEAENSETCERIHASVREQVALHPQVNAVIEKYPGLVETDLLPLEEQIKRGWPYAPGNTPPRQDTVQAREEMKREKKAFETIRDATRKAGKIVMEHMKADEAETTTATATVTGDSAELEQAVAHFYESSVAPVWHEINGRP